MVASGYSIFAVVGYYLANVEISKDKRKIIYLLAILGVAAHFLGTWLLSTPETGINLLFKGYANAPSFLYAVGVFVFFKYFNYDKLPGKKLINYLSKLTFGIYLMHIYVVWEAPGLLGFNNCSLVWRTAGALGVFILCAIVTGIIKKIPVVNKILVP